MLFASLCRREISRRQLRADLLHVIHPNLFHIIIHVLSASKLKTSLTFHALLVLSYLQPPKVETDETKKLAELIWNVGRCHANFYVRQSASLAFPKVLILPLPWLGNIQAILHGPDNANAKHGAFLFLAALKNLRPCDKFILLAIKDICVSLVRFDTLWSLCPLSILCLLELSVDHLDLFPDKLRFMRVTGWGHESVVQFAALHFLPKWKDPTEISNFFSNADRDLKAKILHGLLNERRHVHLKFSMNEDWEVASLLLAFTCLGPKMAAIRYALKVNQTTFFICLGETYAAVASLVSPSICTCMRNFRECSSGKPFDAFSRDS